MKCFIPITLASSLISLASAQNSKPATLVPLDPTREVTVHDLESRRHTPLTEEYIWTADDSIADARVDYSRPGLTERVEPHYFRVAFQLSAVPHDATLYLAGPRRVSVWINGRLADQVESDLTSPLGMHVFATGAAPFLHAGLNLIAVEAIRGRGVPAFANSALLKQQTFGEILVAKLVPAAQGVDAPPLLRSGKQWKSSTTLSESWQQPAFKDDNWRSVRSIGGIESSIELLQWNADAGLYDWPGYDGISGFLAHIPLTPHVVLNTYAGRGAFAGLNTLTGTPGEFAVNLPAANVADFEAPNVVLDFGRELTGRMELVSASDHPALVTVQLGESESEMMKDPYLGVNQLYIAPHATAHSPKSAFRYAKIRFLSGGPQLRFQTIRADHIYYPVQYLGSFESSDPLLNRIWEVGAYTAHLCMQDGIWDASKRDRGRWMGDTDVSGRVIADVFGDRPLMEDTLDRLIGPSPVDQHVNGIPGYSSFWITEIADYYRHSGSREFLEREHARLLQLLQYVDKEFDARNIYANKSNVWLYVDWSPELNGDTAETRRATTLEFLRAYREAVFLLQELNDSANALRYEKLARDIKAASQKYLFDGGTDSFGPRWQTNAAAVISGAADPRQYPTLWKNVFSHVPEGTHGLIISPYYNYYVIRAMGEMDHRVEALRWIREYWGGMIKQDATTFWEGYDPTWYKDNFHASLQADNGSGYFVSLAHGWSAGPTAWLMEQVLGIQPTSAGFTQVDIRPDLADLAWARGAEPTPRGLLKVEVRKGSSSPAIVIDLPEGVCAHVSVPVPAATSQVMLTGRALQGKSAEDGRRSIVQLDHAGHYELSIK